MYSFSIKLAHHYTKILILESVVISLMVFSLKNFIASGGPIVCNGANIGYTFYNRRSHKVSKKKWEGKLVLLKREKVHDPYDPRSLWIPHLCQLSNHRLLQNKPALSARAAQRASILTFVQPKGVMLTS